MTVGISARQWVLYLCHVCTQIALLGDRYTVSSLSVTTLPLPLHICSWTHGWLEPWEEWRWGDHLYSQLQPWEREVSEYEMMSSDEGTVVIRSWWTVKNWQKSTCSTHWVDALLTWLARWCPVFTLQFLKTKLPVVRVNYICIMNNY